MLVYRRDKTQTVSGNFFGVSVRLSTRNCCLKDVTFKLSYQLIIFKYKAIFLTLHTQSLREKISRLNNIPTFLHVQYVQ